MTTETCCALVSSVGELVGLGNLEIYYLPALDSIGSLSFPAVLLVSVRFSLSCTVKLLLNKNKNNST